MVSSENKRELQTNTIYSSISKYIYTCIWLYTSNQRRLPPSGISYILSASLIISIASLYNTEVSCFKEFYLLTHSSRMQRSHCITLSYWMSHPCVVHCLQTMAVLDSLYGRIGCHMIKQSSQHGCLKMAVIL